MRTGVRSRIADPVCPSGKSHQRAPVSTRGSPPRSRAATVLCKSRSPLRAHKAGPARPPPPPALPAPAPRPLSSSDTQTGLCPAPGPVARCGLCGSPQATARRCAFRGPALRPLLREAVPEKPACSGHGCPSTHFLLRLPSQVKSVARPGRPLRPPPPAAPSGCVRSAQHGAWHTGPSRYIPPATRKYNRRTGRRRNPCGPWWRVKRGGPQPHLRGFTPKK